MAVFIPGMDHDMIPVTLNASNEVVITQERSSSPPNVKEQEKRVRREIANSNERRRMQSINAGFQSLRNLLPIPDGEKLSKAAILQQTTNLIYRLEQEKTQLLNQIAGLKRMIRKGGEMDPDSPGVKKRKRNDSMMDEGIGSPEGMEESSMEEMQKSILELRSQLDRERQYRKVLEDKNRVLEAKFYPEKLKQLTRQIQVKEEVVVEDSTKSTREYRLEEIQERERLQLEEQTLAAAAAALESCSAGVNNTATIVSCTQPTTTAAIRQNLETIYKAIRHVEGATPVQTPNPTPTPEDERREMEEGEPEGSIRVIRQVEDIEASVHDAGNDRQRIKVQLVHPLHMLTTRPTSITVS
ncbi:uncharacterized protein [Apostichopus japonicus]|uniref:uncharacterized protein n=1 Tax=Stichopus japonicus TaxID=307972 RepID=UPI003AB5E343